MWKVHFDLVPIAAWTQEGINAMDKKLLTVGSPGGSAGKESACNAGGLCVIPRLGRSPGEGKGYPLQYSGLENSMDCIAHRVTKIWIRLRATFTSLMILIEINGKILACEIFFSICLPATPKEKH